MTCPLQYHMFYEIITVIEFHWAIFRSNIWFKFRIVITIERWLQKFSPIFFHYIAKTWFNGTIRKFNVFYWFKTFTWFLQENFYFLRNFIQNNGLKHCKRSISLKQSERCSLMALLNYLRTTLSHIIQSKSESPKICPLLTEFNDMLKPSQCSD